jgi:hypothetical protein
MSSELGGVLTCPVPSYPSPPSWGSLGNLQPEMMVKISIQKFTQNELKT